MSEESKTNANTEESKSAFEQQIEKIEKQAELGVRLRRVEMRLKNGNEPIGLSIVRIAANIAVILLFAMGVFALLLPFCVSSDRIGKIFPETKTVRIFTVAVDRSDAGSDRAQTPEKMTALVPTEETITSCAPRVFAFWGYGFFILAIFGGGLWTIVSLNKQE